MYVSICVCMYVCDDKIITMGRKMSGFKKVGLVYFSGFLLSFHFYCLFFLLLRFIFIYIICSCICWKKLGCEKVSTVHFLSYSNFFHFHLFYSFHFLFSISFLFLFFSHLFFLFGSNTLFIIAFCLFDNFFISLFPLKIRVVHLLLFFLMEKF